MKSLVWNVKISGTPAVIRRCGKCGNDRFVSSGRFRVNANGSRIDVWLIFKCGCCNATWNMEILSRVKAGRIDGERYESFLKNDEALAQHYALDSPTLERTGATAATDALAIEIEGKAPTDAEASFISIVPSVPSDVSAIMVIAQKLGISRSAVRRLIAERQIESVLDLKKRKLRGEVSFYLHAGWAKRE